MLATQIGDETRTFLQQLVPVGGVEEPVPGPPAPEVMQTVSDVGHHAVHIEDREHPVSVE